jgi:hypothetical protein
MRISGVKRFAETWDIVGPFGERLSVPRAKRSGVFHVGLLGTQRRVKLKRPAFQVAAELFHGLGRPVYVIDTRRDGVGAQGSWSPRELASRIPDHITTLANRGGVTAQRYGYLHLPDLAPSLGLLDRYRSARGAKSRLSPEALAETVELVEHGVAPADPCAWRHWQVFRAAYLRELSERPFAVLTARAFVEAASLVSGPGGSGLAIFLCSEPHTPEFDSASNAEGTDQADHAYCHRYSLAAEVSRSILRDLPGSRVERVALSLGEPADIRAYG